MTLQFFANFGAEEGDVAPPRGPPRLPVLRNIEQAWKSLFVAGAPVFGALAASPALVAWLNTPRAAEAAARARLPLFGASPDVVPAVHDKAFCVRVAREHGLFEPELDSVITVVDADDINLEALERAMVFPPGWRHHDDVKLDNFTIKPRFGSSGRGRVDGRRLLHVLPALTRLRERGGVIVEPWLQRVADLSTQWLIGAEGRIEFLGTTLAETSLSGVWASARVIVDDAGVPHAWGVPFQVGPEKRFVENSFLVVEAAARAGYRGPCGVDGFSYVRHPGGPLEFRLCEFNARFTAGLIAVCLARALPPGSRATFAPSSSPDLLLHPAETPLE